MSILKIFEANLSQQKLDDVEEQYESQDFEIDEEILKNQEELIKLRQYEEYIIKTYCR